MTRNSETELALIERLRAGDSTAMTDLTRAYGPHIHQLALRYLKNHEDAEELAQDVLLKVYQKIGAFRGDSALSSWMYRITFNAAMSRLRTLKFSRPHEVSEFQGRDGAEGPGNAGLPWEPADWSGMADESLLRQQMRERLEEAVQTLPAIYRAPVLLRDVHGLSTEEASRRLNVKTQTLKSRLHRGRLILRELLGDFSTGLTLRPAA